VLYLGQLTAIRADSRARGLAIGVGQGKFYEKRIGKNCAPVPRLGGGCAGGGAA